MPVLVPTPWWAHTTWKNLQNCIRMPRTMASWCTIRISNPTNRCFSTPEVQWELSPFEWSKSFLLNRPLHVHIRSGPPCKTALKSSGEGLYSALIGISIRANRSIYTLKILGKMSPFGGPIWLFQNLSSDVHIPNETLCKTVLKSSRRQLYNEPLGLQTKLTFAFTPLTYRVRWAFLEGPNLCFKTRHLVCRYQMEHFPKRHMKAPDKGFMVQHLHFKSNKHLHS